MRTQNCHLTSDPSFQRRRRNTSDATSSDVEKWGKKEEKDKVTIASSYSHIVSTRYVGDVNMM